MAEPKVTTHSEEKEVSNESKEAEEESHNEQDDKAKDTDNKKLDKRIKKEVVKRSYKYETKRHKEIEDSRRTKRGEKAFPSNKREEERNDDVGKKRYSESRKSYDSQRDKYKDRDKNKTYDNKNKSMSNDAGTIKGKSTEKSSVEVNVPTEDAEKAQTNKGNGDNFENKKITKHKTIVEKLAPKSSSMHKTTKPDDPVRETRRKSFDNSTSVTKNEDEFSKSKVEIGENKRRNSVGSRQSTAESNSFKYFLNSLSLDNKNEDKEDLYNDNPSKSSLGHKHVSSEENFSSPCFENKDKDVVKRRNSTGDRSSPEKSSPRRNSLGSEDKNKTCTFIDTTISSNVICEESKSKEQNTEKKVKNSSDPRTERRIRNKVIFIFIYKYYIYIQQLHC